jgi:hypothetical protein
MWKELVSRFASDARFSEPATVQELARVERELNVQLPTELRACLEESNGVKDEYGFGLIWSVERIIKDNLMFRTYPDFRTLYMPFDCLLFFSDAAGNGDQFAYAILAAEVRMENIYVWNHEDDSRTWVAFGLAKFLEWWLTGVIKL